MIFEKFDLEKMANKVISNRRLDERGRDLELLTVVFILIYLFLLIPIMSV